MEETRTCSNINHYYYGSTHERDKVPIELFEKPKSTVFYKTCIDCRIYDKNKTTNRKKNHKEKYKLSIDNESDLMYCPGKAHLTASELDRDKVPKISFRQFKDYEDSPLFTYCEDCRKNTALQNKAKDDKLKETDKLLCNYCNKEVDKDEFAYNLNGVLSSTCKLCKVIQHDREARLQTLSQTIKYEMMEKYESCCYICKNVFIKNPLNDKTMFEIQTYLINNVRYLDYQGIIYQSLDFIKSNKNILMLQVLQFDHLTEEEQRQRGMLRDDQPFIPKKCTVLDARNDFLMRAEAAKCQLCCMKCHLLETIHREKGLGVVSKLGRIKLDHINKLKEEGCVLCGYKNNDLPRYFHFDHLDVENKIERVSQLLTDKHTFQDVLDEIAKCRILCQPCHFIHTRDQYEKGLFHKLAIYRQNKL